MPFWNEARQERVKKRVFKLIVILKLLSNILKVVGLIVGGTGVILLIMTIFNYASFGSPMIIFWGFAMYLGGVMLRKFLAGLLGETEVIE